MTGNRMSSLDITQYCGAAGTLSQLSASGRPAVMGSAFHAICSDDADKNDWLMKLTKEEREEVGEWHKPQPLVLDVLGVESTFLYKDATKEMEVALDSKGRYCTADDSDCITVGHFDMSWVVEVDGQRIVIVGDIKKSAFTVDGADTLQLTAYGLAVAEMVKADGYISAIWAATEGRWLIGKLVMLEDAGEQWARVKHAAMNVSERETMGNHCSKCYGWQRCKAYTLKATDPALSGMMDGELVTEANAAEMLIQADMLVRVGKLAKERIKLYAAKHPVSDGNGKRWAQVNSKGRESVMGVKKLRARMGKDAEKYIKRGASIATFRWVNE